MTGKSRATVPDIESDPFGERSSTLVCKPLQLLGGRVEFDSTSRELLRLVDSAYAGLPRHRLSTRAPDLRIRLLLMSPRKTHGSGTGQRPSRWEPAPLTMLH